MSERRDAIGDSSRRFGDGVAPAFGTGLTDGERRDIRKCQRLIQKEISEGGIHPDEDGNQDAFEDARLRNNALFRSVRYTREAVLDGDNVHLIATLAVRKLRRSNQASIRRYPH